MSDLNSYLLTKMGWKAYDGFYGILINKQRQPTCYDEDGLIKWWIIDIDRKIGFLIRTLKTIEKQNEKNLYNFVIVNNCDVFSNFSKKSKHQSISFSTNEELFKLIREWESCNSVYQRHFRINKILK